MASLAVAVVSYSPDLTLLQRTLQSLTVALEEAHGVYAIDHAELYIVDNGPNGRWTEELRRLLEMSSGSRSFLSIYVVTGQGNVGYGMGNNLALSHSVADYLLVLNPDVNVAPSALIEAIGFMNAHPGVGLVAPHVLGPDGQRQFLCKRSPSVLDLALRGFAPEGLRRRFCTRLARYEMRDLPADKLTLGIPIVSGCFMFFRGDLFRQLSGFDPRFFMYFEDFDLSLRVGKLSDIAFVPAVTVEHYGGGASRKGWRHVKMFVKSAWIFFRKYGWRWL
jgi:GT2 family glycosyltransferase